MVPPRRIRTDSRARSGFRVDAFTPAGSEQPDPAGLSTLPVPELCRSTGTPWSPPSPHSPCHLLYMNATRLFMSTYKKRHRHPKTGRPGRAGSAFLGVHVSMVLLPAAASVVVDRLPSIGRATSRGPRRGHARPGDRLHDWPGGRAGRPLGFVDCDVAVVDFRCEIALGWAGGDTRRPELGSECGYCVDIRRRRGDLPLWHGGVTSYPPETGSRRLHDSLGAAIWQAAPPSSDTVVEARPCRCRQWCPRTSSGVVVFVEDAAESILSPDVKVLDWVWVGDGFG